MRLRTNNSYLTSGSANVYRPSLPRESIRVAKNLKHYICSMSRNYKFHNPFTVVPKIIAEKKEFWMVLLLLNKAPRKDSRGSGGSRFSFSSDISQTKYLA
jgi:hypothetical protein